MKNAIKRFKNWISDILSKIFMKNNIDDSMDNVCEEKETNEDIIAPNRSIINKLNYLENYINIFKDMFPNEYSDYLNKIRKQKCEYDEELSKYEESYNTNKLTFSIDPEYESKKLSEAIVLENDINTFIENDVKFRLWKIRLSELCYKLNKLYNFSMTSSNKYDVFKQVEKASETLEKNTRELKNELFFNSDIRKKTELTEYVFYSNYLIFKIFLRCNNSTDFTDFKEKVKIDDFFEVTEYDSSVLKFLIDELQNIKAYISSELSDDKMFSVLLDRYDRIEQAFIENENEIVSDSAYFGKILQSENMIAGVAKIHNKEFNIPLSILIDLSYYNPNDKVLSAKYYALVILELIINEESNISAIILNKVITNISDEMTYEEFFFLCKVFDLHSKIKEYSSKMALNNIVSNFERLDKKYDEWYSDEKVIDKKRKVLKYKKISKGDYVMLFKSDKSEVGKIVSKLNEILIDYYISNEEVYINPIYFKGFKNIENLFN